MGRLQDKVVLITGAAQGTGEATARLAVREGARVVVADIQSEKAASVAKSLGNNALSCELDVGSEGRAAEVPDEGPHPPAVPPQRLHQPPADEAGGAGHQYQFSALSCICSRGAHGRPAYY